MVLAIKFSDDEYFNNKFYAKMGGISCKDLNKLETNFFQALNYDLTVMPETFEKYSNFLISKYMKQDQTMPIFTK